MGEGLTRPGTSRSSVQLLVARGATLSSVVQPLARCPSFCSQPLIHAHPENRNETQRVTTNTKIKAQKQKADHVGREGGFREGEWGEREMEGQHEDTLYEGLRVTAITV